MRKAGSGRGAMTALAGVNHDGSGSEIDFARAKPSGTFQNPRSLLQCVVQVTAKSIAFA